MWMAIVALPLYTSWLELHTRDKRLHICACMSRITCSIECTPPLSAYHSLCSLISFLSLLNGFLSLSSHHKCILSPLLFFNTYKTEKARPGPGHLEAPVKLSPRPGSLPLASCSIVSGPSQLIPCIAIVAGHCLQPPPTPPGYPLRLSWGLPCLILFCKLLSPGSPLITVHGLCKPTQGRQGWGMGEHTRYPQWA